MASPEQPRPIPTASLPQTRVQFPSDVPPPVSPSPPPRTPENRRTLLPDARRARTRSTDLVRSASGASIPRPTGYRTSIPSPLGPTARRRTVTHTMTRKVKDREGTSEPFDPSLYDFGIPGLGDDYFANNIDPKLAEDVKHALEIKQRRDARKSLSVKQPVPPPVEHVPSPLTSLAASAPIDPYASQIVDSPISSIKSTTSSGASDQPQPLLSSDPPLIHTGPPELPLTRERTSSGTKVLGIFPRRKTKDRLILEDLAKLEEQFDEKVAKIRENMKPKALKHAATTKNQLERHYSFFLNPPDNLHGRPPNLMDVIRWRRITWNGSHQSHASVKEAKSVDWLTHLASLHLPSTGSKKYGQVPWHLTALHLEEYLKVRRALDTPDPLPQIQVIQEQADPPPEPIQKTVSQESPEKPRIKSISLSSPLIHAGFPRPSLDIPKTPLRIEGEGSRSSLEGLAVDGNKRLKRLSFPTSGSNLRESPGVSRINTSATPSPTSSHLLSNFFGVGRRLKLHASDEGEPGNRNSISDESVIGRSRPGTPDSKKAQLTSMSDDEVRERAQTKSRGLHLAKKSWQSLVASHKPLMLSDGEAKKPAEETPTARDYGPGFDPKIPRKTFRVTQVSAPATARPFTLEERETIRKRLEHAEELQRIEYEKRDRILIDTTHRNETAHRLLNTVGRLIREYARIQVLLAHELGIDYHPLPKELTEVLPDSAHRPRLIGWRAVEEAHARRERLGQILDDFLSASTKHPDRLQMHPPEYGISEKISDLLQKLAEINTLRAEVVKQQEALSVNRRFAEGNITRMKNVEQVAETSILGSFPEASELHNLTSKVIKRNPTWVTVAQLISNPLEITANAILKLIATAVRTRRRMEQWRLWWIFGVPFGLLRFITKMLWWMVLLVLPKVRREVAIGAAHLLILGWFIWHWYR